ncbi:hypothetical protein BS50DRAFT_569860 [Corynespora cassiicola Philippines]|uniref:Secreted protein n=1 Tax=Corynespora cassiicola Philippines TaxID=1448308 RepID=A0A2T2P403_CORCC|nr:hypothetical protein BS50DRAFT_569860 [Corynespora cassiicola Philippines]
MGRLCGSSLGPPSGAWLLVVLELGRLLGRALARSIAHEMNVPRCLSRQAFMHQRWSDGRRPLDAFYTPQVVAAAVACPGPGCSPPPRRYWASTSLAVSDRADQSEAPSCQPRWFRW